MSRRRVRSQRLRVPGWLAEANATCLGGQVSYDKLFGAAELGERHLEELVDIG
jgi:hypothetical protein